MIRVELSETGTRRVRLTSEQGRLLADSGLVEASPARGEPGFWSVRSRRKVGVAQVGDLEVWVAPKLTIDRLLFLVGYALDPKGWRDEEVGLDPHAGLVPATARALCWHTERALAGGLLQGYRTVEECSLVLRGRLREADQLRRHHGLAMPMEIRRDDFTVDTAENRILLAAVTRMLGVPRLDTESDRRLAAVRGRLAGVRQLGQADPLPAWQPTRLNQRYHSALRLAEAIWQATSPEHAPGDVPAIGFLFDLWKIFQDFVVVALSERLGATQPGARSLQHPCYLDEAELLPMYPDLVWEHGGRPLAVVDAKYKPEASRDALYQMLAYCTTLGLRRGHLVYAAGRAEPARHVVRRTGVEIWCHALHLDHPARALLAEVAAIADNLLSDPLPV
jgi:5-methylcytosine-specific restriction enzyme subunit McrC